MTVYRIALVAFLGVGLVATAQDSAQIVLSKDKTEASKFDSLELRPNTKQPFFIIVKNLLPQQTTFTVEVEGLKGTPLQLVEKVTLSKKGDKGDSQVVAFKPTTPPKKEEPPKAAVEPKKEADAPEPPTGVPVALADLPDGRTFAFKVRVKDDQGNPPAERTVRITIQHPSKYLQEPDVTLEGTGRRRDLTALITLKNEPLIPPVDVKFEFPPQLGLKADARGAGSYRRKLEKPGQQVTMRAENLALTAVDVPVKFYFTVDGYPRAFNYSSNVRRAIEVNPAANKEKRLTAPAVRLIPIGTGPKYQAMEARVVSGTTTTPRVATLPTKELRFRVEVDNEAPGSVLGLRIARSGALVRATDLDPDEVIDLGLAKDERVWLDPAGPDGALLATNTIGDHIATVDVSALRGSHELQAVLKEPDATSPTKVKEFKSSYTLVVDDTPPPAGDIRLGTFPKRLVRGQPLPVFVVASDPETAIERVGVVLGKPGPDGKLPPDAPVTFAERTPLGWVAQVPMPAPPPAPPAAPPPAPPPKKEPIPPFDITIVAENEVGLSTAKVVRIELVEPAGGTIKLRIERGGRPQPGTAVTLRDAAGAEKGVGTTGDGTKGTEKGVVYFRNLAPGIYRMTALKEDSSLGLAGVVAAQIPDPPTDKPVEVVLPLVKRR